MDVTLLYGFGQSYTALLGSIAIALLAILLMRDWLARRPVKGLTGLPVLGDLPIIGSMVFVEKNPSEYLKQLLGLCDEYRKKEIFAIRFGTNYIFRIFTASQVEKLLKVHGFVEKSPGYKFMHNWLGQSLFTSTTETWKRQRRMLRPCFNITLLKDALETMNKHAFNLRDMLLQDVKGKYTDKPFNILRLFALLSLDIISETAMGIQIDALEHDDAEHEHAEYVKAVFLCKDSISRRIRTPWLHPNFIFNNSPTGRAVQRATDFMHNFAYKVINERRAATKGAEGTTKNLAFLDMLLNCRDADGTPLTDTEIRQEVDTFMFAGHDTVSAALSFTTYLLGNHPEIQEKCYQELLETFGSPKHFTMEDLSKMAYLDWCVKESMRLYSPVPMIARAITSDIELAGHNIPKGSGGISVPLSALHRDPSAFPEPEKFDPTRFSPEKSANRHPYAYMPFAAGPRNCIGQKFAMWKVKTVLATFLMSFKIKSLQRTDDELGLNPGITLEAEKGIWITITPR